MDRRLSLWSSRKGLYLASICFLALSIEFGLQSINLGLESRLPLLDAFRHAEDDADDEGVEGEVTVPLLSEPPLVEGVARGVRRGGGGGGGGVELLEVSEGEVGVEEEEEGEGDGEQGDEVDLRDGRETRRQLEEQEDGGEEGEEQLQLPRRRRQVTEKRGEQWR